MRREPVPRSGAGAWSQRIQVGAAPNTGPPFAGAKMPVPKDRAGVIALFWRVVAA